MKLIKIDEVPALIETLEFLETTCILDQKGFKISVKNIDTGKIVSNETLDLDEFGIKLMYIIFNNSKLANLSLKQKSER